MIRGSEEVKPWESDYDFWRKEMFADPSWPQMYFVEQSYSNDQTNWWIPNRAAAEAMLRSSGLEIESHPESETWICTPDAAFTRRPFCASLWSWMERCRHSAFFARGEMRARLRGTRRMVEAVMLWNEPNNLSHWDFTIDPEWKQFAALVHAGC